MRIAQISPLYESVPPKLYGGTERIVYYLTEELVRLGHHVTLFASGDSKTSAELVAACEKATRLDSVCKDPIARHVLMIEQVIKRAADFDIIHSHIEYLPLPAFRSLLVPVLTSIHSRLDVPEVQDVYREFVDAPLVSVSDAQRAPIPWANWRATVHHGIPVDLYSPEYSDGKYLAFLGRFSPEKGPVDAIQIALAAGLPLKMAAKVDLDNKHYFESHVAPLIEGNRAIENIGEINERGKQEFLSGARALLMPICWPEPFGLVAIEAMACGTPVIAFRHGAAPEIIEEGVTGFVVGTVDEATAALDRVSMLDRRRVRKAFEQRFVSTRMADNYLTAYRDVLFSQSGIRMVVNS